MLSIDKSPLQNHDGRDAAVVAAAGGFLVDGLERESRALVAGERGEQASAVAAADLADVADEPEAGGDLAGERGTRSSAFIMAAKYDGDDDVPNPFSRPFFCV